VRKIRVIAQFNLASFKLPLEHNQHFKVLFVSKLEVIRPREALVEEGTLNRG